MEEDVTVVLCSMNSRRRKGLTDTEAEKIIGLLEGDKRCIPQLRNTTKNKNEEPKSRRTLTTLKTTLNEWMYLEVRESTKEECTKWLGNNGEIVGADGRASYMEIVCLCPQFWRTGRICNCSVGYAAHKNLLYKQLKPKELMSTLLSSHPISGAPRLLQGNCRSWQLDFPSIESMQEPRSKTTMKADFLEQNDRLRAHGHVVVKKVEANGQLRYVGGRIIGCPPSSRAQKKRAKSNIGSQKTDTSNANKWKISFLDRREVDQFLGKNTVAGYLLEADIMGCGGVYAAMDEFEVSTAELTTVSYNEHMQIIQSHMEKMTGIIKQNKPLRWLGYLVLSWTRTLSDKIWMEFGRVVGFIRVECSESVRWVIMSNENSFKEVELKELSRGILTCDYALNLKKQSASKGKIIM